MGIRGITVLLQVVTETGKDLTNRPIYKDRWIPVDNVLIAPVSTEDQITSIQLHGKTAVYQLGIPKDDTHIWDDRLVRFAGRTWHVFGLPETGIADNIPGPWNTKWKVEAYG